MLPRETPIHPDRVFEFEKAMEKILIDDQLIWDINRPLERDCRLKFLHFLEDNCEEQNRAYWRTSSFLLGYLLETAFKSEYHVELCSFPPPSFQHG